MPNQDQADRLRQLVVNSLDDSLGTAPGLPRRVHQSRTEFHRLFRALLAETPAAMRRRLLLERAAWQLGQTVAPVTEVALDAAYGSLEAFTRAFGKAFGVSPSIYRRMGLRYFRLSGASGVHYFSPATSNKGAFTMDLFERFAGYENWYARKILDHARQLTDDQLERPIAPTDLTPWDTRPEGTLRQLLDRIVFTKEAWTAALTGGPMPEMDRKLSPTQMLEHYDRAESEFQRALCDVHNRGAWDDTFVDALCQPPETFTFGGVLAHIVTYNSYRCLTAAAVMRGMGIDAVGFGDPIDYERSITRHTHV